MGIVSTLDNALQALFSMAHKELLWQNASPTSGFPAQKVPLHLTSGSIVYVVFKQASSAATYYVGTFSVDGTTQQYSEYYGKASGCYSQQAMRTLTVETTGITFSAGTMVTANALPDTNNVYFIPIKIYEIKG